jgi:hypothetical protein
MTDTRADIALVWLTGSPGGWEIAEPSASWAARNPAGWGTGRAGPRG